MRKAIKEFIESAKPRSRHDYQEFWIIDSEQYYDGFWGKNGYNNIILIGRAIDGECELITEHSDVAHFFKDCGGFNVDIKKDLGAIHIWFDKPVYLSGGLVTSSVIFTGEKE